ncbi:MAG TPA: hypothetical protein VFC94_04720 [Bacteroidaceae bacterium]|nr:hypothetical protein [Bacteroidaceae bacterium]
MRQSQKRKLNNIKFISLSFILFIISDIVGKLFFPNNETVNYLYRIELWGLSLIIGGTIFYGAKKISLRRFKVVFFTLFLVYLVILRISGFYIYGETYLIGYKISAAIMPLLAYIARFKATPFLRWYGRAVMKLTGAGTIRNIKSIISLLILVLFAATILIVANKMSGKLYSSGNYVHQFIIEGVLSH